MGRSVSYPSAAQVVTFNYMEPVECPTCEGSGRDLETVTGEDEECPRCDGSGTVEPDEFDFDCLIDDFRDHLRTLFPSVVSADEWIDREDHVLAENKLARFGMSEYCGLVSYWIVPQESGFYADEAHIDQFAKRWIASIADKFVAAFGELTKVGSLSNGEGVYRRIDKA